MYTAVTGRISKANREPHDPSKVAWGDVGDYVEARDVRRNEQFVSDNPLAGGAATQIFKKVFAFVSPGIGVLLDPPWERENGEVVARVDYREVTKLLLLHGGETSTSIVAKLSHFIGTDVPVWLRRTYSSRNVSRTEFLFVHPLWIIESVKARTRLSEEQYLLKDGIPQTRLWWNPEEKSNALRSEPMLSKTNQSPSTSAALDNAGHSPSESNSKETDGKAQTLPKATSQQTFAPPTTAAFDVAAPPFNLSPNSAERNNRLSSDIGEDLQVLIDPSPSSQGDAPHVVRLESGSPFVNEEIDFFQIASQSDLPVTLVDKVSSQSLAGKTDEEKQLPLPEEPSDPLQQKNSGPLLDPQHPPALPSPHPDTTTTIQTRHPLPLHPAAAVTFVRQPSTITASAALPKQTPINQNLQPQIVASVAGQTAGVTHGTNQTADRFSAPQSRSFPPPSSGGRMLTSSENPNFVRDYFQKSRLHHLSMWKLQFQEELARYLATQIKANAPRPKDASRLIAHVDFDAFFVSVALTRWPEHASSAVVVSHGGSTSDIASCNYLARAAGVKKGMLMKEAREKCANLVVLPYTFDAYESASKKYTNVLQIKSCEEALLDVSHVSNDIADARMMMNQLRAEVKAATGCTCSVGLGTNLLLARLALQKAKPDGLGVAPDPAKEGGSAIQEFVSSFALGDLPLIGWRTKAMLRDSNIQSISDLMKLDLSRIEKLFGKKSGAKMFGYLRGSDETELLPSHVRQSVGVDLTYAIRFSNNQQIENFFYDVAAEVSRRLRQGMYKGRKITINIMQRSSNAPNSHKHLGHGWCDSFSRSVRRSAPTDDPTIIASESWKLYLTLKIPPLELRFSAKLLMFPFLFSSLMNSGVGIHISGLDGGFSNPKDTKRRQLDAPSSSQPTIEALMKKQQILNTLKNHSEDVSRNANDQDPPTVAPKVPKRPNANKSSLLHFMEVKDKPIADENILPQVEKDQGDTAVARPADGSIAQIDLMILSEDNTPNPSPESNPEMEDHKPEEKSRADVRSPIVVADTGASVAMSKKRSREDEQQSDDNKRPRGDHTDLPQQGPAPNGNFEVVSISSVDHSDVVPLSPSTSSSMSHTPGLRQVPTLFHCEAFSAFRSVFEAWATQVDEPSAVEIELLAQLVRHYAMHRQLEDITMMAKSLDTVVRGNRRWKATQEFLVTLAKDLVKEIYHAELLL